MSTEGKSRKLSIGTRFLNWVEAKWPGTSIDTALRYFPVARLIKKDGLSNARILDVGSGPAGIRPYIHTDIVSVDANFPQTDISKGIIKASAGSLPFKNNEFDYVVLVDVLEHIPKSDRGKAVEEAIRVARGKVFIAVPCGNGAEKQDKLLSEYYKMRHGGDEYPFLKEHIGCGLPSEDEILKYLNGPATVTQICKNVNLKLRSFYMRLYFSKFSVFYTFGRILLPLLRFFNYGECYRKIFVAKKI